MRWKSARAYVGCVACIGAVATVACTEDPRAQTALAFTGTVLDADGAPQRYASLRLQARENPLLTVGPTVSTNTVGNYLFDARWLEEGQPIVLLVQAPRRLPQLCRTEANPSTGALRSISLRPSREVVGLVRSPTGDPCTGAAVWAAGEQDPGAPFSTDTAGRFSFEAPIGDRIAVRVQAPGWCPAERSIVIDPPTVEPGTPVQLTVVMCPSGTVEGTAETALNGTLESVHVSLLKVCNSDEQLPLFRRSVVSSDGSFHLDSLPPGEYVLTVGTALRRASVIERVSVRCGQSTVRKVVLPN